MKFFKKKRMFFKNLFLYFYLTDWVHWEAKVKPFIYPVDSEPEYSSILVQNVDNTRMMYLINLLVKQNKVRRNI